jgi:deoxyribodipyrimidine photo-lyase
MKSPVVHWFTSDLRLGDNPALALDAAAAPVAAAFVFDPASLRRAAAAPRRIAFLRATLAALDADLAARGTRLLVATGDPAVLLPRLAARLGAHAVTHARNGEPAARRREARVAAALARDGIALANADASLVHPPGTVLTGRGEASLAYGPFARAWSARPVRPPVAEPRRWWPLSAPPDEAWSCGVDPAPSAELPPAGEAAARARLAAFVRAGLAAYAERRDHPGIDGTARVSHHLRFGALSAADACRRARAAAARRPAARRGALAWLRELAWRDFFAHLLAAFPRLAHEPLRPLPVRYRADDRALRHWQEGRTGYPFVDAGMRQLAATGWMHNRARLVAASFLVRHLLVDGREGERHFMTLLLDGQLAQNGGNWQWVAGTGADAQPPYRVFSPVRQGERFDPEGDYVRRWLPELARVPAAAVHAPWTLSRAERRALCPHYPPPIVDAGEARARALAAVGEALARRRDARH